MVAGTDGSRPTGLAAVFEPRRVAVVGASAQPGRTGKVIWDNLSGFPGEVIPVARGVDEIDGRKAYASLRDVDGDIDLAIVAVPARAALEVVGDAVAKGVPAAVLVTAGFAETGPDGAALQDEIVAAARRGGLRIVGPNCLGVQNCDLPLNASISTGLPRGGGGISLVTQSGAYGMAIHILGVDEGVAFAKVYSAGNKCEITDADVLAYLREDGASRTLCFLLESLPDGRAFCDEARRTTPTHPVIVAKSGRSAAGARAALSHTAALAADQAVLAGALEGAGVLLVRSGLEMLDVARALDTQPVPAGSRVGIVTNSGGTGVELADLLAEGGLDVPALSDALRDELVPLLPAFASARNPVDVTPVWSRYAELYPMLVERLARSGEVDIVISVLMGRAALDDGVIAALGETSQRLRAEGCPVPVYVCWMAPAAARPNAVALQHAGVPCYDWTERTARATAAAYRYGQVRARPPAPARTGVPERRPPAFMNAGPLPAGLLDPDVGARLLGEFGIPTVESALCPDAGAAVAAADAFGYPVVAKVVHPEIVHKTEVGGVRLDLADAAAVHAAATALAAAAPGARVLIQAQRAGTELVVGGLRDPAFGPVVVVGLGGVFVEVVADVAFGLAPLSEADAHRLLERLVAFPALRGHRGRPPVDLDAVVRVIRGVGDLLVAVPEVAELDLNPVLAGESGCVAVDWRLLISPL